MLVNSEQGHVVRKAYDPLLPTSGRRSITSYMAFQRNVPRTEPCGTPPVTSYLKTWKYCIQTSQSVLSVDMYKRMYLLNALLLRSIVPKVWWWYAVDVRFSIFIYLHISSITGSLRVSLFLTFGIYNIYVCTLLYEESYFSNNSVFVFSLSFLYCLYELLELDRHEM